MMSSTLGAPLGGTMRGGHQGLESLALSLITPPNFGGGGGSCFPSSVVVALGEPGEPVTCCAAATGATVASKNIRETTAGWPTNTKPSFTISLLIRNRDLKCENKPVVDETLIVGETLVSEEMSSPSERSICIRGAAKRRRNFAMVAVLLAGFVGWAPHSPPRGMVWITGDEFSMAAQVPAHMTEVGI